MRDRTKSIYIENGYRDRQDYLQSLADELNIPFGIVKMCAEMLGPSEDFDGLVTTLEDEFCL
jgi:hypothetical protein